MSFSPELAAIRFGCGLSPVIAPPDRAETLLSGLLAPDALAARFEIESFNGFSERLIKARRIRRESASRKEITEEIGKIRKQLSVDRNRWHTMRLLRWVWTDTPFRERLTAFWSDHFTVKGKTSIMLSGILPYQQDAIRPYLTGRFSDMLIATTTHPMMLHFLDQSSSIGPQSRRAKVSDKQRGLNENLAREVLELHTLGVDGPYTQKDVRQLAGLFTGLTYDVQDGFRFRKGIAEPGAETVLGQSYGGNPAQLDAILAALHDLSVHPATARHIARKLAVHFIDDNPDPALVDHVTARFLETDGNLMAVYAALLEHPSAWAGGPQNVKPPLDYVASACRALAMDQGDIAALSPQALRRTLVNPLALMGQPLFRPAGPDGWAEQDEVWITPQAVSARLRWALSVPARLRRNLPEPRAFAEAALGPYVTEAVRFAADAAESRSDAVGLVLSAPAFQRR